MAQTTIEEIEFEATNEHAMMSDIRHGFRIPAKAIGKVVIDIYGTNFDVVDVGSNGLGILINYEGLFYSSEKLGGINITINSKRFSLKGEVVHITPTGVNKYHCGISLSSLYRDEKPEFEKAVHELREKVFPAKTEPIQ